MITKLHWSDFSKNGDVCHIASYDLINQSQPELHTHDYAEIFWIQEGSGLEIGDSETRSIVKGSLSIVHPEVNHRFASQGQMTLINVAFPAHIFTQMSQIYNSVDLIHSSQIAPLYQISENGLTELNRALSELIRSPNQTAYLWRFLSRCMCVLQPETDVVSAEAPHWLQRVCQQINEPEYARGGMRAFVKLAGRSPEHVSRITKKWTGHTPSELVQDARLSLVARELAVTNKPILEITMDAGFENLGHCYKLFKQKYGMPPAEYRKSQKRLPAGIQL